MATKKETTTIAISALQALQADSERLKQLEGILPDIIKEGYLKRLQELPTEALPAFAWRGLSNAELREHDGPGADYEKLRRSFAGLQRLNAQRAPEEAIYPTCSFLGKIAGADTTTAQRWAKEPLIEYELSGYIEALAPSLRLECEQIEHNVLLGSQLGESLESLVQWPAEYD